MSCPDIPKAVILAVAMALTAGCATSEPSPEASATGPRLRPTPQASPASQPPHDENGTPVMSLSMGDFDDLQQRERAKRERARVLVDHHVTIGRAALERGQLRHAQRAFAAALESDPTHGEARRLWTTVSGLLGDTVADREAERQSTWDTTRARIDQITFLARERFRRARHFHGEGRYDEAILEYHKAKILLETNLQADADFDALRIKAAIERAEADKSTAERRAEARRIEETEAIVRAQDAKERRKIASRVRRLWQMANEAYDRGEYTACERLCEKIMELDPGGQVVHSLRR